MSFITALVAMLGFSEKIDASTSLSSESVICATDLESLGEEEKDDYDTFSADNNNLFFSYSGTNSKRQVRTNIRRKCSNNNYGGEYSFEYVIKRNTTYHTYLPKNIQSSSVPCQDYVVLLRKIVI